MEAELLELYADPTVDTKPELLSKRGGAFYSEAAVELIASLHGDRRRGRPVVNVRNDGTLPFLPDDAVIEVPADRRRLRRAPGAAARADRAAATRGLIAHVTAYEELALDAAIHGGGDRVRTALLAHPLIGQADLADKLADALIAAEPRASCRGHRSPVAAVLASTAGTARPTSRWPTADGTVLAARAGRRPSRRTWTAWPGRSSRGRQGVGAIRAELGLAADEPLAEHAGRLRRRRRPPREERGAGRGVRRRAAGPRRVEVGNDTFALLRAGTSRPVGRRRGLRRGHQLRRHRPGRPARALPGDRHVYRRLGRRPGLGETRDCSRRCAPRTAAARRPR